MNKDLIINKTGTIILLQTTNECNNLYVESKSYNNRILIDILEALRYWHKECGIEYIQVKGRFGRYTSICKHFKGLLDSERTDEEVWYFKLSEVFK